MEQGDLFTNMRQLRQLLIALLLLGCGTGRIVWAEAAQEPSWATPPGFAAALKTWVDSAHAGISQRILGTADYFDGFFGDERIDNEKQNTQIFLEMASTVGPDAAPVFSFPIGIKLSLPRLKNRVQFAVDTMLQEESEVAANESEEQNTDIQIRLRYKMLEQIGRWVGVDAGVKMNFDTIGWKTLEPFSAMRFRRTFGFEPWAIRLTHLTSWHGQSGWSGLSAVDLERYLSQKTFFRIRGTSKYAEEFSGQQYTTTLFLRRQLSHNRAIGLQFFSEGHTHPDMQTDMSEIQFTYRRRIYKEWAFLTIQPAIQYAREENFAMRPLLRCNAQFYFGRVAP